MHYSLRQVTSLDRWAYSAAESRLSKDVKCHVAESTIGLIESAYDPLYGPVLWEVCGPIVVVVSA